MNLTFEVKRNYLIIFLLLVILTVAYYFRLNFFLNHAVFLGDEGRDLLIARHIAKYGENITIGHASGIHISHTNYYYYLIALVTRMIDNPYGIFYFIMVANFLTVVLLFLTGSNLFNREVGLYASLLLGISSIGVDSSRVWSDFIGLTLFITSLFLFSLFYNKQKIIYLFPFVLTLLFTGFISFEFLYPVPIFILLTVYLVSKFYREKLKIILFTIILWIINIVIFTLPLFIYQSEQISDLLSNPDSHIFSLESLSTKFNYYVGELNRIVLSFEINKEFQYILPAVLLILFAGGIKTLSQYKKLLAFWLCGLSIIILGFVLALVKSGVYTGHYLWGLAPIIYLMLAYILSSNSITNSLKTTITIISLVSILSLYRIDKIYNATDNSDILSSNTLYQNEVISKSIYTKLLDYDLQRVPFIVLAKSSGDNEYTSPSYIYYFLEKLVGQKLVDIKEYENFLPLVTLEESKLLFLICRDYADLNMTESDCLNSFKSTKSGYSNVSLFWTHGSVFVFMLESDLL